MYRVMIVDDESYVIKSLITTINWNLHEFEVVGQADNGIKALELIRDLKPDLVFTDVKMPGMGGLELIKTANQEFKNILFVVISGYAEFSYAQKAMNYGALGYCLKPFEENEIVGILSKARSILDIARAALEMKLLELLEDKSEDGVENAGKVFNALGFVFDSAYKILVVVAIGHGKLSFPNYVKCINLKIGNNKNAYLLEYNGTTSINELFSVKIPDHIKGIGTCLTNCSLEGVKPAIDEALVAANQFFISGNAGFYESRPQNKESYNNPMLQLERAIDSKDSTNIRRVLDSMESSSTLKAFDIRQALRVYNMVMSFLYRLDSVKYEDYIYSYDQLTGQYQNVHEMLAYLKETLSKQISMGNENMHEDVSNETFRSIFGYVNDNYCKDISIQSISQKFLIRPNYVSQLFKKELDITFTDYLTRLRISYACSLLKTTSLTVNEIAGRVGYDEYYYFTRVFKKVTGKTPTEFRH